MKTMNPNDFGKKYLTEQCQKIVLSDFVRQASRKIKEAILKAEIEVSGCSVRLTQSKTGFGGSRFWFICPGCGMRVGVVYKHPVGQIVGCRTCLRLDYKKHRFRGMVEDGT